MKSLSTIPHLKQQQQQKRYSIKLSSFQTKCALIHTASTQNQQKPNLKKKLKVQFCTLYMAQCNVTS